MGSLYYGFLFNSLVHQKLFKVTFFLFLKYPSHKPCNAQLPMNTSEYPAAQIALLPPVPAPHPGLIQHPHPADADRGSDRSLTQKLPELIHTRPPTHTCALQHFTGHSPPRGLPA